MEKLRAEQLEKMQQILDAELANMRKKIHEDLKFR
jgi:hypothetical protein